MKIMFSAGEPSGDVHGESLARAVLEKCPQAELVGFGGPKMAAAGVRLCSDMREYSIMGVWEVIKNLRRIFALLDKLEAFMRAEKPDLLVLIDYPDFNWRLAKKAKAMGIPVFSYIPPSAWAWRKGRARKCAAIADEFAAIFPFELPVYEAAGANISFNGNPLVDTVKPSMTETEARRYFGVPDGKQPVILLPGSRRQEINMLLPSMLEAAELLRQENDVLEFYLPVAPGIDRKLVTDIAAPYKVTVHYTEDKNYDLMSIGSFALATSGTVVMEAALLGLPCVCLYKMASFNYAIGKLLVDIEFFTLPNILMGRQVQKELLQNEVTGPRIFEEARKYYAEKGFRDRVLEGLREAVAKLGKPGAASRVAEKILAAAERYGRDRLEVSK
ncbi:Lipid-A-disaccharide synthase [Anaerovibrio sp. JC8]|uniref:lipid-A-disaccharide synthase n=1 Tax=Anaerovibrio sp. JC8 TaxID=1240085 RepID=UPI000A0AF701|nr:lipid-A-disaccharide synthase [Anaerovibrio sp. JC8]ORU00945.1 Lipid-A-disaccharide synthase [Anaerovibrio sp. JC8]